MRGPRRNKARTRAESSVNEKGLMRQSSAPVSSDRTRSSTRLRAVRTSTGREGFFGANRVQYRNAVEFWQVKVENHQIILALAGHLSRQFAIAGDVDCVMLGLQPLAYETGERSIVFDDQNTHRVTLKRLLSFLSAATYAVNAFLRLSQLDSHIGTGK